MKGKKFRNLVFLGDVLAFMLTSFGGPQAHLAILLNDFVRKRNYLTEEELMELYALTQILPGPSSTQTIIGVAYKIGGLWLSLITFLIWAVPSAAIMCFIAISYGSLSLNAQFTKVLSFIQPVALGIVAFAAYSFGKTALKSEVNIILCLCAIAASLILRSPYAFPILILLGGIISSATETKVEEDQLRTKLFSNINTRKVAYFIGILLLFGLLGAIINRTSPFSLPIRLFENFYRNGIIIFGGGQVLVPLMYTEFVDVKHYLTGAEFLSGFAFQQMIPGPTFSFTSFLGAMSLGNRGYGIGGQILGSLIAVVGINAPGMILVLFIVPFWEDLKKITRIKRSLSGINAVAVGFMIAAFFLLVAPVGLNFLSFGIMLATFLILRFTKIKTPYIILFGVLMGVFLS
ncbi:chromate efflux transporter [Pedobacter sp. SD-b]|uniref:Chromate efflux transporter n=1 Tax=Pedobacter segetis TaxID=2793069 RepID=A0ABS1BJB5_9SPHI|nr:chromate efflux transporter [Pedobacter segetis]MBK0382436.1 chromate efflux transporter [Pedobacter segetis]